MNKKNEKTESPSVSSINPAAQPPRKAPIDPRNIIIGRPNLLVQSTPVVSSSVITVVRDPRNSLGKTFTLNPDGTISKKAAVSISLGIAVMHQVDTPEEFAGLLRKVGDDPHAAIINASFDGIDVGEEFLILSEREIEKKLGIPRTDREKQKGVHRLTYNERDYKVVGRFKENVLSSSWQYFDRDIDEHTPGQFAKQSFEEWKATLAEIVPGLADVSCCRVGSTSARVYHEGKPVGGGNGHLWLKFSNPKDVERFRTAILIAAAKAGLTWMKPRYSSKETGTIVGHSLTTIFDPSVLTPGRLTFIGQPVVSDGLTVEPLSTSIYIGEKVSVDTELVALPDKKNILEITRKAGVEMDIQKGDKGLRITVNDLTLETELETEDQGLLTVKTIVEQGINGKIRCQTPFRDSSSFAAFVASTAEGKPFVHDVGTGITHWLNNSDSKELGIICATGFVKGLLGKVKEDCGAPFEHDALQALKIIQQQQPAEYQRIRANLKSLNKDISVVQLDKSVKTQLASDANGENVPETHHGYARDILAQLTEDGWAPVAYEGILYGADLKDSIWVKHPLEKVVRLVAEKHDGNSHCARSADYSGIAQHALMLATDDTFFRDAAIGLATPGGFYKIKGDQIQVVPLTPAHRQRVKINITPEAMEMPLFNQFLHDTFQSTLPEEESQQVMLVQELAGAIMTGCMHKFHKAALFYDAFGRSGKGTLERILRKLVPSSFVTAVSPFNWDKEYYLASLVGARLNVVGELPDSKAIPAAAFKTVTGGDLLTGRHPNLRPISFKNEAAHLFMSNHFITTSDHSEAFFTRWLLVEFPNSRLRLGLPLDTGLADRIIQKEIAGIAHWALIGAKRLLTQGAFSPSIVHVRLMEQWRRTTNSLDEFIHECCERGSEYSERRSELYQQYKSWCGENGRRPFAKGKIKELLAYNIGLGVSLTVLDGYEIFRGIQMKKTELDVTSLSPLKKW